jgi:hypothetical protein
MTKSSKSGPVAQLGARFHGMEEVIGSIPIRSTNFLSTIQTNLPGEISDLAGAKTALARLFPVPDCQFSCGFK